MSSIEDYMLPCINKQLFGFDCLGCGLQRAIALIFQGHFIDAFKMYPAVYTLILLAIVLVLNIFMSFKHQESIKKWLFIVNIAIIVISYFIKLSTTNIQ
ncbi:conserved hypothetical protein (DUF2752) [Formosa agariphila KMM 3901]|uniref:DUF2752 domain-containing protein n=1 Tax=Formosa agariphila (strain DSM 15362 / KCTC 12365 / LMG 23005 / KMM 3901 / M-2Alg 35-1) TaxID=1347342 RepID=T2KJM4_FORAG|nr:DUF2752 domain-containing protein [Formosa agariphila]CDF78970.1 conserved hypothetical protein (DUF2752) [Formosa agariphila KMM 3901]